MRLVHQPRPIPARPRSSWLHPTAHPQEPTAVARLIALLSYYDEQPEHLHSLVTSLHIAGITHLVAVDGAYALYPNGRACSSGWETLYPATREHDISLHHHTPLIAWAGNEIEKRTHLFALGHQLAEPGIDWLLVIDADEHITHPHHPYELDGHDVLTVTHAEPGVRIARERRWYRAQPTGIRVHGAHSHYETGDGTVLWGSTEVQAGETSMVIEHTPKHRTRARRNGRRDYYEARLLTNAEITP